MKFLNIIVAATMLATLLGSCSKDVIVGESMIIPAPQKIETKAGTYILDNALSIGISDKTLEPAALFLQSLIEKSTGIVAPITDKGAIMLTVDASKAQTEAYTLNVNDKGIEIVGGGYGGVLYGIETLRQLMPKEIEAANGAANNLLAIQHVSIEDAPRFKWRGFMLDVSRHFYNTQEVKQFIDMMAYYKLNKFHWHLTDDQGWRIEIKQYPLLTEKGAWRKFNSQDRECQSRAALEENKDYEIDTTKMSIMDTDTLYGGFYTQDEIRDIVAYAKNLNIDVIPEIDMPGHFLSGVENYDGVACSDETGWGALFSSPICPGKDTALEFCKNIYNEIFELFPYEYAHLGADEVDKANWIKCKDCQSRMRKHGLKNEHELQAWFVKYMEKHFNANGKKLIGWDEIIEGGLSETATIMWWRNWAPKAIPTATAQGNQVISSPCFTLYFDAQQNKNSLKNVYEYEPILKGLSDEQIKLFLGVQANLWCEWIPSMERAEYMAFPRMLALAELGWADPDKKDWTNFVERVVANMQKLDVMGINYRPLDLTGFNSTNTFTAPDSLTIACAQKDISVYYTTDGTTPTTASTKYTTPIKVDKTTDFILRTFRPNGTAADIVKTKVVIEDYAPALKNVEIKGEGLVAKWYNYKGSKCSEITTAKFKKEFIVDSVCIPKGAKDNIGLVIEGYFEAPKSDVYTFKLQSDDGSMLYMNDQEIVNNDGAHALREVVGQKALAKGLHKIRVEFFDHNGGKLKLTVADQKGTTIEYPNDKYGFKY